MAVKRRYLARRQSVIGMMLFGLAGYGSSVIADTATYSSTTAKPSYQISASAHYWSGSTKINNVRQDRADSPVLAFDLAHQLAYVPQLNLRYTHIDANDVGMDKYDYTFYYTVLTHNMMSMDVGLTLTHYANTRFRVEGQREYDFEKWHRSWYLNGKLAIPNTSVDIIGHVNFAEHNDLKSTDFTAGVQYQWLLKQGQLALQGGYRVMDLELKNLQPNTSPSYLFIDGFFAALQWQF